MTVKNINEDRIEAIKERFSEALRQYWLAVESEDNERISFYAGSVSGWRAVLLILGVTEEETEQIKERVRREIWEEVSESKK